MCYVPTVGLMAATNACKGAIKTLAVGGRIGSILNFVTLEQQLATSHLGEMALWNLGSTRMAQTTIGQNWNFNFVVETYVAPRGASNKPMGLQVTRINFC